MIGYGEKSENGIRLCSVKKDIIYTDRTDLCRNGDTFGYDFKPNPANPGPNGGSWRSNVLAFSEDNDLEAIW